MTAPTGYANQQVQSQRVSIQTVDPVAGTATALTRYTTTVTINTDYHVGAIHVTPAIGEQWYVKRIGSDWVLDRKVTFNTAVKANVIANPTSGIYQIGSSGPDTGPLHLLGSQINAMAPLKLFAGNSPLPDPTTVSAGSLAYNGTIPVYSTGSAWVPLTTGGAGEAYILPVGGIPASDMAAAVQADLADAVSAYQKPSGGIPTSDLDSATQTAISNAAGAYVKPSGGIPATDMTTAVQTNLALAASAMQTIPNGSVSTAQLSAGGTASNTTFLRGDNVWAVPAGGGGGGSTGIYSATTSSATTLSLSTTYQIYVFTGTVATTWTLPAVASTSGQFFYLENQGSAPITLVPTTGDHIYHHVAVTSVTIAPGSTYHVINNGTYWGALNPVVNVDSQHWWANQADTTKLAQLNLANIATGTTRTFNLPNASGTLAVGANATNGKLPVAAIDASGTPSSSNYLRGDGTWNTIGVMSGASINRTSTTTVACANGTAVLPNSFWGNTTSASSDITVNLTTGSLQVSVAGWYLVNVQLNLINIPSQNGGFIEVMLFKNGSLFQQGAMTGIYTSGSGLFANSTVPSTFALPLAASDSIQIGTATSGTGFTIAGDASGTLCMFSLVRMNP